MEVAGIEPASFSLSPSILRAQPVIFSAACSPLAPSGGYSQLNFPYDRLAQPQGKPRFMTPAIGPQGLDQTDGLLIKQPVLVALLPLLAFIGFPVVLRGIRGPRLASLGSTAKVETDHPHVKVPTARLVYPGAGSGVPGAARAAGQAYGAPGPAARRGTAGDHGGNVGRQHDANGGPVRLDE